MIPAPIETRESTAHASKIANTIPYPIIGLSKNNMDNYYM